MPPACKTCELRRNRSRGLSGRFTHRAKWCSTAREWLALNFTNLPTLPARTPPLPLATSPVPRPTRRRTRLLTAWHADLPRSSRNRRGRWARAARPCFRDLLLPHRTAVPPVLIGLLLRPPRPAPPDRRWRRAGPPFP